MGMFPTLPTQYTYCSHDDDEGREETGASDLIPSPGWDYGIPSLPGLPLSPPLAGPHTTDHAEGHSAAEFSLPWFVDCVSKKDLGRSPAVLGCFRWRLQAG